MVTFLSNQIPSGSGEGCKCQGQMPFAQPHRSTHMINDGIVKVENQSPEWGTADGSQPCLLSWIPKVLSDCCLSPSTTGLSNAICFVGDRFMTVGSYVLLQH